MKPKHFVRTPYNYDADKVSTDTGLLCKDKSLTQQEFAEESNINYIAERYGLTGELPTVTRLPTYGTFEGVFDFQTAQNAIRAAQEGFMELPAKLRARFDNSPQKLMEFMDNPENLDEARKLGLVNAAQEAPAEPAKGNPSPEAAPQGGTPAKT